jgi:hypothetical protein
MSEMKRAIVGVVIGIAIAFGVAAFWYSEWSSDAYGSTAYFRRIVGRAPERVTLIASCRSIGYDLHVYDLSTQAGSHFSIHDLELARLPGRASYQNHHIRSSWHVGPRDLYDWRLAFTAISAARDAQSGSCAVSSSGVVDALERSIRSERQMIAHSYAVAGDNIDVFNFYLLDLESGRLYDVYGAA